MNSEVTLGILGGMGPMATVAFQECVINHTKVSSDQEHIKTIVINDPSIPDRTDYLLAKPGAVSPFADILRCARALESYGADYIAMPCVTAHGFFDELQAELSIPLLNMISLTVGRLLKCNVKVAGLLATAGTVKAGIFQEAMHKAGIATLVPSHRKQEAISSIIYSDIKRGNPANIDAFNAVCDSLRARGATCIVLGCTELPLIKRQVCLGAGFVDTTEVLAIEAVSVAGRVACGVGQQIWS